MTATNSHASPSLMSRLVTAILGIKPVFNFAKQRARAMMVKRAAAIGVDWPGEVKALRSRQPSELGPDQKDVSIHPNWEAELAALRNDQLVYPDYYVRSFHAYEEGNLGWRPAMEADVAGKTVHAKIWEGAGAKGDRMLRKSYYDVVKDTISIAPRQILDIGSSAGHSTFGLRSLYPMAQCTGVDLSPYFLTVAQYFETIHNGMPPVSTSGLAVKNLVPVGTPASNSAPAAKPFSPIRWVHAAGESTGLEDESFDLASICLVMHELPSDATRKLLAEMRRVLKPGGYVAIMDMNPKADIYLKMPPYILTLLKSTEPFLDEYFSLDLEQAVWDAGFTRPSVTHNSPRHRTVIAQAR
ncbi:MAG: class I SAM-dependent methyltransferase [Cyanobacteria bacterium P01_F01_bin.150]